MNIRSLLHAGLWLAVCLCCSCKKDKQDSVNPSSLDLSKVTSSNIRLFNFTDFDVDITINNVPLTAYGSKDQSGAIVPGTGSSTQTGMQLFPKGAWKAAAGGSPFSIPTSLLDKNGATNIRLTMLDKQIDTVLKNEPLQPKDYYILRKFKNNVNEYSIRALNRVSNPPAQAQYFKIRILNTQQEDDPVGLNGPVTLTYADGTPVSSKLSNIAPNASSEYVEIPYGAYQFKLFVSNGMSIDVTKQLTELPAQPDYQSNKPLPQPQQGCITAVKTYKPGAAYTLMISGTAMPYLDKYPDGGSEVARAIFNLNAYRLITDIDPGINFSFARVQAANATPGGKLKILIDGESISGELDFGESSPYKIITRGDHTISLTDAAGKQLTEKKLTIYPYDNYTVWAWQNKEGQPELLFSAVDMTATNYNYNAMTTSTSDGSAFLNLTPYAWSTRFLNLAPDLPYATFTNDQSLLLEGQTPFGGSPQPSTAAYNLAAGKVPALDPFLVYATGKKTLGLGSAGNYPPTIIATLIRVYKSTGAYAELPGQVLSQVEPLKVQESFVANPALYTVPGLKPWAEGGIYTVALIGKTSTAAAAEKARLIVIKHNQ